MAAHGEAKQFGFALEAFEAGRLVERDAGQLLQAGGWNEPALIRVGGSAKGFQKVLRLPELAGARFAEFVKRSGTNHRLQFLPGRRHAAEEIGHRSKWAVRARGEQTSGCSAGQSFDPRQRDTDWFAARHKRRPRLSDTGRRRLEAASHAYT